ncbi:MAG TPA: hypothetical protein VF196_03835, partial [Casimicrobiaceae bacterium]
MERREPRIFRAKPRPEPDPHALAPHEVPVADASSFELGAWTNKAAPQWPYASLVRCALAGPPGETFRRTLSPGEVDGWLAALARGEAVRWLSAAPGARKSSKLRLDD